MNTDALVIDGLDVAYRVGGGEQAVLRGVSFRIAPGEAYGLVGESGCGKSTIAFGIMRYLPANGRVRGGRVLLGGTDVMALAPGALRRLRARDVSMVYQDPAKALNPSMRIGPQLVEAFELAGVPDAPARALDMLGRMRIVDGERVARAYPHQLSGGMLQRVVIAMALASSPKLLILDEPTTGLDAKVAAEILTLLEALRRKSGLALLFISHDLSVIRRMCDRMGVLYAGELVEEGPVAALLDGPRHPYTVGLLRCLPQAGRGRAQGALDTIPGFPPRLGAIIAGCVFAERCGLATLHCREVPPPPHVFDGRMSRCHDHDRAGDLPLASPPVQRRGAIDREAPPLLEVRGLSKSYGRVKALDGVDLAIWQGETLGLVGESGSGKTTLARLLLGLAMPDPGGTIALAGEVLGPVRRRSAEAVRAVQMVFQNPDSALNRAHAVRRIIGRALTRLAGLTGADRARRLTDLAHAARLPEAYLGVRPGRLSGGLKQRVAIARAFAGTPRLILCDEPTASLDVSVQAAILNLLVELQDTQGVAYLFVSHDLAVMRHIADRIAVLYRGEIVEIGPADALFTGPRHPYTEALLGIQAEPDPAPAPRGQGGCIFRDGCGIKLGSICDNLTPEPITVGPGHVIRCHAF